MEQQKEGIDYFSSLPCDIIGIILSKISSPRDLCRLSAVSAALRSATKSDFLWEKFVPYDYLSIVTSNSTFTSSFFGPNKALFFHICNHHSPIFLQSKLLEVDKSSGKIICTLGTAEIYAAVNNKSYYRWTWLIFPELNSRWRLIANKMKTIKTGNGFEIMSEIDTQVLSRNTTYEAYFIFQISEPTYKYKPFYFLTKVSIRSSILSESQVVHLVSQRDDGLLELKIGEFHNSERHGVYGHVVTMNVEELNEFEPSTRTCFLVFGIELRPKILK